MMKTEPNYYSHFFRTLLAWHYLEPEYCDLIRDPHGEQPDAFFVKRFAGWSKVQLISSVDEDRVQGVLQERIKEHGWLVEIVINATGNKDTTVTLYHGEINTPMIHESTMMALLQAYVIALTLEKSRGENETSS